MTKTLLALITLLLSACSARVDPASASSPGECYMQTEGKVVHINCVDPVADIKAAGVTCREVGSDLADECSQVLAGAACVTIDVDSFHCELNV